jgi:UDP-N-acetylmuramoyl-tripeptide--D-alanyl-D-alanine ligase
MKSWNAQQLAHHAGATLLSTPAGAGGPSAVSIDSRDVGPGVLFVGLAGEHVHGGAFVEQALAAGAWGVLSDFAHVEDAVAASDGGDSGGALLAVADPLVGLGRLATAWRRQLGAAGTRVIAVTGSTGKTSTKDLLAALLEPQRRTLVSEGNFNTEIGLPLQLLRAAAATEVIVLEMGMRGPGQIAQLAQIAEPDVGVIVSIGPVHLELLGSLEAIAAAKAELIAALPTGATAIVPAREVLLDPHLRPDLDTVSFGPEGEVRLLAQTPQSVSIEHRGERIELEVNFTQAHLRANLLAAVAAACAVGVRPRGEVCLRLSPGRGQAVELDHGITLLDSAYNANPMSMRAALDELAAHPGGERRRIAVLGDMLELGPQERVYHAAVGQYARGRADVLVSVGERAQVIGEAFAGEHHHAADVAAAIPIVTGLLGADDVVLVKASNGVGLSRLCEALMAPRAVGAAS